MTGLAELLADCDARGIRLIPTSDEGLTIDAPERALTPDLVERLRIHKVGLLAILRATGGSQRPGQRPTVDHRRISRSLTEPPDHDSKRCYWCGRSEWWLSIYGREVCGWCHPPAVPGLVKRWLSPPEKKETADQES